MKYYKVVRKIGDHLTSAIARSCAVVYYTVGEWHNAPNWLASEGYGLFVFAHFYHARLFKNTCFFHNDLHIYECEVYGVFDSLPVYMSVGVISNGTVCPMKYASFPRGTIMVKSVKLIEEVYGG